MIPIERVKSVAKEKGLYATLDKMLGGRRGGKQKAPPSAIT